MKKSLSFDLYRISKIFLLGMVDIHNYFTTETKIFPTYNYIIITLYDVDIQFFYIK